MAQGGAALYCRQIGHSPYGVRLSSNVLGNDSSLLDDSSDSTPLAASPMFAPRT